MKAIVDIVAAAISINSIPALILTICWTSVVIENIVKVFAYSISLQTMNSLLPCL